MKKKTVSIIIILIMLISCGIAFADGIVVAFEKREYKILAGKTEIIRPIIQGTTLTGKYVYSSSDETVATVNNGQVKGISPGDATINCTVTIGSDEFSCSYVIHVLQPVTKIEVPVKSMVLPAGAILNELPFIVLPENAANKEIDIISNNSKIELSSDGYFRVPNIKGGTYTYTFKTTDGSNVTAQFSVTVPKGAWFSVDNNIIIDDPAGIDLFYVITDDHTTNVLIHTSESYSTNGIVRVGSSKKDITELLEGRPFSFRTQDMTMIEAPRIVHFEPLKVGKGQFVITGDKGMILTSSDGINWTIQNSQSTSLLMRSRYANGMYIAVGYNGAILQSIDGINWQDISNNHSGVIYGLCVHNDRFVMTSNYYSSTHTIPLRYFDVSRELSSDGDADSSLFFFDKELNMLGIVDYFISLRWRRKYFEAGEFEIVLPVNDYVMQFIDKNVLVMRNNYTEAGIIETIEFSDNGTDEELIISGRFLSSLLERRIVKSKINFSGNTIEGMNTIVNAMTPLTEQWETEAVTMTSPHIDFQVSYKNVYEYLCKLAEYSNIGFRIVPNVDSKVYMFEAWEGKDRTSEQSINEQYSFSDDNYNIEQGKLVISEKTKVNYVLVGGQGEDTSRVLVSVDEGISGFDRYEVFSDQKSLTKGNLSDNDYKAKLRSVGEGKLSDGTFQLEVTALVQQDYKEKWNLGDIVNIKKEKWGVYTTYRIIEVEETIEDGKKTIYPTFGSPLSSAWDDE